MSLTSDDIADIKQLMESVVSTALIDFERRTDAKFNAIDAKFEAIHAHLEEHDEKLDEIMNAVGQDLVKHSATLDDHGARLRRLEQTSA